VEWVEFRRQLKKPIKTPSGVTESINRLDEFGDRVISPDRLFGKASQTSGRVYFCQKTERHSDQALAT
jgi:hypothetical protein